MTKEIQEGRDAYHNNFNVADNPYPEKSIECSDWDYGFIRERSIDNGDIVPKCDL